MGELNYDAIVIARHWVHAEDVAHKVAVAGAHVYTVESRTCSVSHAVVVVVVRVLIANVVCVRRLSLVRSKAVAQLVCCEEIRELVRALRLMVAGASGPQEQE